MKTMRNAILMGLCAPLCVATLSCIDEVEEERDDTAAEASFAQGLTKGTPGAINGATNYCDDEFNLCGLGEGDCDRGSQCEAGLICGRDNGFKFGFDPPGSDVCVPAHCEDNAVSGDESGLDCGGSCGECPVLNPYSVGDPLYCADPNFPCGVGEGDCRLDSECAGALICGFNNGDKFGFSSGLDVCVPAHCQDNVLSGNESAVDCGGSCGMCIGSNPYTLGNPNYCSDPNFPCAAGEGDCNSNVQCQTGLLCGFNNGSKFGFSSGTDVCVPAQCTNRKLDALLEETGIDCGGVCGTCPQTNPFPNGHPRRCLDPNFPCDVGEGNCTGTSQCLGGLVCKRDSGAKFGLAAGLDVCDVPLCGNTVQDAGEAGVDCGASCGTSCDPEAVQMAQGEFFMCTLFNDGTVRCNGANQDGQLGRGTTTTRSATPARALGISDATSISVGSKHACALIQNGTVKCWGDNAQGQLGNGSLKGRTASAIVPNLNNAVAIDVRERSSCALLSDGTVKCWGLNTAGQLGDTTTTRRTVPVTVTGVDDAVALFGSNSGGPNTFRCALINDGTVKCWGYNADGQLGRGNRRSGATPALVSGLTQAESLSLGRDHACALRSNGEAKCWGDNGSGRLGDGTKINRTRPVTVSGVSAATSISATRSHTCALIDDGTVKCWGVNTQGELGDGTLTSRSVGTTVSGLSNATAIQTGFSYTCALLDDGGAKCWGRNGPFGQLGNNSTATSTTPVEVLNLSQAESIWAKFNYVCAILEDGEAKCWGRNNSGQLGDGTTTARLKPVSVLF